MPQHYYIDGYNVVHKSNILKPLINQDLEAAREALIEKVAQFCTATGHQATIVFDGRSRHQPNATPDPKTVPGLNIIFSPSNLTADAVIERNVYKAQDRLNLVVVSNDQGVRDLCRGLGALVMEPDYFLQSARESRQGVTETLKRTQKEKPDFLESLLDQDTLNHLKNLKDKL